MVVRARSKNHRYGYVTMATPEQAEKSIKALHNTELKGWKICVDLVRKCVTLLLSKLYDFSRHNLHGLALVKKFSRPFCGSNSTAPMNGIGE